MTTVEKRIEWTVGSIAQPPFEEGQLVEKTHYFPQASVFAPAATVTYRGTVQHVYDSRNGAGWYVVLRDVEFRSSRYPDVVEHKSTVTLEAGGKWAVIV